MASRCRSFSRPTITLLKSTISKPTINPTISSLRSSPTLPRSIARLGSLHSLLPLHNAVSSARLISGLSVVNSRSMSQGMLGSANPGV